LEGTISNKFKQFETFSNNLEQVAFWRCERTIPNNFAQSFYHETHEINETHEKEPGFSRTIYGFTPQSFRSGGKNFFVDRRV